MGFTLEMAAEAFSDWRKNRSSTSEKLPDSLIKMVRNLYPSCGPKVLKKSLGVTRAQLESFGLFEAGEIHTTNKQINNIEGQFAISTIASLSNNIELILQKGESTLTLKLPAQELASCINAVGALL